MKYIKPYDDEYQSILFDNGNVIVQNHINEKQNKIFQINYNSIFCSYDSDHPNGVLLWKNKPKSYIGMVSISKWNEICDSYYRWNIKKNKEQIIYSSSPSHSRKNLEKSSLEIDVNYRKTYDQELLNSFQKGIEEFNKLPTNIKPLDVDNIEKDRKRKPLKYDRLSSRNSPVYNKKKTEPLIKQSYLQNSIKTTYPSLISNAVLSPRYNQLKYTQLYILIYFIVHQIFYVLLHQLKQVE